MNSGINYMHVSSSGCIFKIMENFQNPPGGLFIAARRHMHLIMVSGLWGGTAWRNIPGR